jgi:C1A family cysteine protease
VKEHSGSWHNSLLTLVAVTISAGFNLLSAQTAMPLGSELIGTGAPLSTQNIQTLQANALGNGLTFDVGPNPATSRYMSMLCGLVPPSPEAMDSLQLNAPVALVSVPAQWDWRQHGGDVPVRDQGQCSSCWAFATVAPLECNIKIKGGPVADLSEQYLVSCNTTGGSCGGGWFAHQMHVSPGAVMESCFPYTASNAPCHDGCAHPYHLNGWGYVAGSGSTIPTVDQLKSAIYQYGPISVAVAVDSYFQAYTSGVFNRSYTGQINHGVTLVGWDDTRQCWIMRNSWSDGWGEQGYMYIKYGCSSIGYGAAYVDYAATNPTNLVAYYPFSGNTLDRSGHGLNGVNHGATLTSDRFGNPNSAYHFNGSSYVTIPGTSAFNGMTSFTLSAWIKPDATNQGVIVSKVSPNRDFVLDVVAGDSGYLNAQFAHDATYYHGWATSPKVPIGTWTHVAATWNGASWQLFINGALAGQASTGGQSPLWTGTDMEIGALLSGGLLGFTGSIDEVRIYNKALAQNEIAREMGQNLIAYYPFNASTNDQSGHGLNGVNHGATLTTDRMGCANAAYHFNGSSYVTIPATAAFNGMGTFTLAAWINPESTTQGVVISKVSPNRDFVLDAVAGASGYLNAQFAYGATYYHGWATSPKIATGAWTHVAAVFDGASWQLFINGTLAGQASTGGNSPLWTGTDMEIGALLAGGLLGFTGSIDEVQVYDTALTPEEITGLTWQ